MKNNLENVPKSEVFSFDGIPYKEFRQQLKPNYLVVWRDILFGIGMILLLGFLTAFIERKYPGWFWITIPAASLLIGYFFAYLELFLHEAAHYNIHPDRATNDFLATWLLGIWVTTNIESYRKIHWDHHRFLGSTQDTENSYFRPLNNRFILENLFGIHAIRVILQRTRKLDSLQSEKETEPGTNAKAFLIGGFLLNFSVAAILFLVGYWQVGLAWLGAVFAVYPLLASLRQLLEHRSDEATAEHDYSKVDHGKVTRFFKPGFFSNTFGGAGFNRHILHHWDPQLSYTRLKDLEQYLRNTPQGRDIIEQSETTYTAVFSRLFKFSFYL